MGLKNYHNVTMDELREVLTAEKGWDLDMTPGTKEYLFQFELTNSPHIVIRVMSGITYGGNSRGCGKDAIRVFAFDTKNCKGYIKTKRVYRIGSWEKNLRAAVLNCFNQAKERRDRYK